MNRTTRRLPLPIALLAALFLPSAAATGLWTPVGCSPVDAARYAEAKRRIVEAEPGDEEYVPHPYPKTARHAVEDFLLTYKGDSGAVAQLFHLDDPAAEEVPSARIAVPDLASARETARARLGRPVSDAQLVAATGYVRCNVLVPCVAFRSDGSIYLLRGDELWRIVDERPYASVSEIRRTRGMVLCPPCEPDDCFVTVGGDALAALLPVEP